MKVEFIEPFVSAAFKVFGMVTNDAPTRGQLALRTNTFTTQQVSIMAGVNGEIEGAVLYGISLITALKIASAMMGSEVQELNEMASSALQELGNMITGNAATLLSQNEYDVDITPPSIIRGMDVAISTRVPALVVPVNTRFGRVEINVAIGEVAEQKAA